MSASPSDRMLASRVVLPVRPSVRGVTPIYLVAMSLVFVCLALWGVASLYADAWWRSQAWWATALGWVFVAVVVGCAAVVVEPLRVLTDHATITFTREAVSIHFPSLLVQDWSIPAEAVEQVEWVPEGSWQSNMVSSTPTLGLSGWHDNLLICLTDGAPPPRVRPRALYNVVSRFTGSPGRMLSSTDLSKVGARAEASRADRDALIRLGYVAPAAH